MKSRLRDGFTDALSAARDARLPLSIVLVLTNDEPDTFDVEHAPGANAVSVVMLIPLGGIGAE